MDFKKLKEIILKNNVFLITTHVNPDADAIGSETSLYFILKNLNKKAFIINHSTTPYNLEFLDTDKVIEKFNEEFHGSLFEEVDAIFCLDFNRSNRVVSMESRLKASKKIKICIDHHQDPENFFDYSFIDTSYAATAHILYDFIEFTHLVEFDKQIALGIYAGIMTDTGSFRFERTDARLHRIVANLLESGVNPAEIYNSLYDNSKFSKIKLLGRALDSLKLNSNNHISYMVLTQKDFSDLDGIESDTENFVNFNLSIENVVVGLLFIQLKNGFKVSFRSKGNFPVNKLAAEFGGGGHLNAAGARFHDNDFFEKIPQVIKKTEEYLEKYGY